MTERTPSTRAGREAMEFLGTRAWLDVILEIEAEARADALREVGELLTAFEWGKDGVGLCSWCGWTRGTYSGHDPDCPLGKAVLLSQPPAPDPQ